EDRPGGAALAVAFEGDAGEAAGDEGEIVEGGPGARPEGAEAANAVAAQLGLDLDVFDDGGRVGAAGLPNIGVGTAVRSFWIHSIFSHSRSCSCPRAGSVSDGARRHRRLRFRRSSTSFAVAFNPILGVGVPSVVRQVAEFCQATREEVLRL